MAHRVRLKRSWTNSFGRTYSVGTVIQCDSELGSMLIKMKYGEVYDGKYPPEKLKMNLSQLKTKDDGSNKW